MMSCSLSLRAPKPEIDFGEALTPANVRSIRPGHGLSPKHLPDVLGKAAARDLKRGDPLDWSMLGALPTARSTAGGSP